MHKNKIIEMEKDLIHERVEYNNYMNLLYSKPKRYMYKKGLLGYIKYRYNEYKYRKDKIINTYNILLSTSPSYNTMCEFADFIRLLERVLFYRNALLKDGEDKYDKLSSDSELSNSKKNLVLELKEDVLITFNMYTKDKDEIIEIKVRYNFGKKAVMNYLVVNREVKYDSIHSENLMITILERLQKAMSKLFLDYYNKI